MTPHRRWAARGAALLTMAALAVAVDRERSAREDERAWAVVRSAPAGSAFVGCESFEALGDRLPATSADTADALAAAARLEATAKRRDRPLDVRRSAAARLRLGHADVAIGLLEDEVSRRPSAEAWNDLSVAYLNAEAPISVVERSMRALDAAMRALTLRPGFTPAALNAAVASTRLHLDAVAVDSVDSERPPCAAQAAPRRSPDPGLLEDVLARADDSRRDTTADTPPQVLVELVERRLLRRWARQIEAGDVEGANAEAARAAVLAARLFARTGDRYVVDLVSDVTRPRGRLEREDRARAWNAYLDAVEGVEAESAGSAESNIRRAGQGIGRAEAALWSTIRLEEASVLRLAGQSSQARTLLEEVERVSAANDHVRPQGRALWYRGLLVEEAGDLGESLSLYTRASTLLERAADLEGVAVVASRLARFYLRISERQRAWAHLDTALALLPNARRYRRDAILRAAAILAKGIDLPGAALGFQGPPLREARALESAGGLAFLLPDVAMSLYGMGASTDAERALAEADRWLSTIGSGPTAPMAAAVLHRSRASVLAPRRPSDALRSLSQALEIYARRGDAFATAELELARGRLLRRGGAAAEARAALTGGVLGIERATAAMPAGQRRRATAAAWDVFRELADVEVAVANYAGALEVLERGRQISRASYRTLVAIPRPDDAVVLTFGVLPSGSFGMVRSAKGDRFFRIDARADEVTALAADYQLRLVAGDADSERLGRRLFALLVQPAGPELAESGRLIVVPDAAVASVPFATLPAGSGLLLASHVIVMQTTLADTVGLDAPEPPLSRAVVFGDPTSAAELSLPPLPWARREAQDVATFYPSAILRVGGAATSAALAADLAAADVWHFAGHAVVDELDPTVSRFVLADDGTGSGGLLFERDLEKLSLARVRLVVLAGCGTGREARPVGPAVFGLARSLLSRGVRAVVATLWSVPDEASSEVFVDFHRSLAGGLGPAAALRHAQLAAAGRGVPAAVWGAVFASGAAFQRPH